MWNLSAFFCLLTNNILQDFLAGAGCYMPAKTKLKTASGPLGKWEAVIKERDVERIKEFLEKPDSLKKKDELNELSKAYLRGQKASTCPSCNRNIINELKAIVRNATPKA